MTSCDAGVFCVLFSRPSFLSLSNSNSALFKWSIRVDFITDCIYSDALLPFSVFSFLPDVTRCSARPESRIPNGPTSRCDDEEEGAQGHLHISSPGLGK